MIARTWIDMGMPITVRIDDPDASEADIDAVAAWFAAVNARYSPFLPESEVCRLNAGTLRRDEVSAEFAHVLDACERARIETGGAFDITRHGAIDPSGYVKGWAIGRASDVLIERGRRHHVVCAGGDLQAVGGRGDGQPWQVGVRNPFHHDQTVKVLAIPAGGVATSGTAARGDHIYDPRRPGPLVTDLASITVVAPRIEEADLMATAAFAMGRDGLAFIAARPHLAIYAITNDGVATYTEGVSTHACR